MGQMLTSRRVRARRVLPALLLPALLGPAVLLAPAAQAAAGDVLTFGGDGYGQLGNGAAGPSSTPSTVLAGAKDVAGGREFSLALVGSTVHAWGSDLKGQVGNGAPYASVTEPVAMLTGAASVASGHYHGLARMTDGTVRAWGWNSRGQLGPVGGAALKSAVPVSLSFGSPVTQVAGGRAHSIALLSDGTVWTWGDNGAGQLGLGVADAERHATPQQVGGLPAIAFVAGGRDSTFAIDTTGSLWAWGSNNYGQLGTGSPAAVGLTPAFVLDRAVQVESGADHTVAVLSTGEVFTWGRNRYGQLGVSGRANRSTPTGVPGLPGVKAAHAGRDHVLATATDGTVYAWGRNDGGQLGADPVTTPKSTRALRVPGLTGVVDAGGGQVHSLVLR